MNKGRSVNRGSGLEVKEIVGVLDEWLEEEIGNVVGVYAPMRYSFDGKGVWFVSRVEMAKELIRWEIERGNGGVVWWCV